MNEAFETWAKANHSLTESAWKAWQAATLAEREACAELCEARGDAIMEQNRMVSAYVMAGECAAAIHARSNALK